MIEICASCLIGLNEKSSATHLTHTLSIQKFKCYFSMIVGNFLSMMLKCCNFFLFFSGSKVYLWDTDKESVVAVLDCSNKIPAADSYHVQKVKKFEGKRQMICEYTFC
jgi:hypothetical protein